MAGLSGGFIAGEDLSATLDEPCLRAKGSFLGAGGIESMPEADLDEMARRYASGALDPQIAAARAA